MFTSSVFKTFLSRNDSLSLKNHFIIRLSWQAMRFWKINIKMMETVFQRCSKKKYSENIQQIYRWTPIPKCDFKKITKQLHGCSLANLLHIFRAPFHEKTYGRQLLKWQLLHFTWLLKVLQCFEISTSTVYLNLCNTSVNIFHHKSFCCYCIPDWLRFVRIWTK